jgi:hypothetical protein
MKSIDIFWLTLFTLSWLFIGALIMMIWRRQQPPATDTSEGIPTAHWPG